MTAVESVDLAVDRYVKRMAKKGIAPTGVRCATLAGLVHVPAWQMSQWLQLHRRAQSRHGAVRWMLGCEHNATDARWQILAGPGSDSTTLQRARAEHLRWIARDAVERVVRDVAYEVRPGLGLSAADALLAVEADALEDAVVTMVRRVERVVAKRSKAAARAAASAIKAGASPVKNGATP